MTWVEYFMSTTTGGIRGIKIKCSLCTKFASRLSLRALGPQAVCNGIEPSLEGRKGFNWELLIL